MTQEAPSCTLLRLGEVVESDDVLREIVELWGDLSPEVPNALALFARQGK